jgi:alpha-beta hydrolase superfamily lysophospholipase
VSAARAVRGIGASRGRPVYLALEPDPVLGFFHPAEAGASTGVILCPPFGWEDVCSYRARRTWADALALAGHPALRIDLPGTGDSGGSPRDPKRLEAWTAAVSASADWLRESSGCSRVAAIGIGLGGMVALRAASEGASIDDLLMWAVPATGRVLLRQLRAFGAMAAAQFPDARPVHGPSLPPGFLEVSGFLISAETARALGELDLTKLALPRAQERRILLLGQEGIAPDERLRARLEALGAEITVDDGPGYAALMQPPELAHEPREVIARSISWLATAPAPAVPAPPPGATREVGEEPPRGRADAVLTVGGVQISESVLNLRVGGVNLVAVLSQPLGAQSPEACALLLNAGAVRRIGPNRAWVDAARRWAARGVPTVRLDLDGIGDSDGDPGVYADESAFHVDELIDRTTGALTELEARGLPSRFLLAGHCSGAYWAARAALSDDRVVAALMINLETFSWNEAVAAERNARRTIALLRRGGAAWLRRDVLTPERVIRVVRSLRPRRDLFKSSRAFRRARTTELDATLNKLRDKGVESLILLSRGEALHDDFVSGGQAAALERWPNLAFETIPSRDHTFRPIWLQEFVHASLDRALARALERARA